jgi:hypothetical protein
MAQSPTSKQVPINNAAKDDLLGNDGIFHFTYDELVAHVLANDPGSAGKSGGFFFGNAAMAAGDHSMAAQIAYLTSDAVGLNYKDGVFTIDADTHDFSYFVQMGNKGTWSQANVDVTTPPPPLDTHHLGAEIAKWDFEDTAAYPQAVNAPTGWQNVAQWAIDNNVNNSYSGTMEVVKDDASHLISNYGANESQWLDTAASPGNIWIQLSEANRTTNLAAGHEAKLSFSVSKQQLGDGTGGSNGGENSHTAEGAYVEFLWNYEVVATVKASDLNDFNHFHEFEVSVFGKDGDANMEHDQLMIRSGGTEFAAQGLAIDHVVLHDWII